MNSTTIRNLVAMMAAVAAVGCGRVGTTSDYDYEPAEPTETGSAPEATPDATPEQEEDQPAPVNHAPYKPATSVDADAVLSGELVNVHVEMEDADGDALIAECALFLSDASSSSDRSDLLSRTNARDFSFVAPVTDGIGVISLICVAKDDAGLLSEPSDAAIVRVNPVLVDDCAANPSLPICKGLGDVFEVINICTVAPALCKMDQSIGGDLMNVQIPQPEVSIPAEFEGRFTDLPFADFTFESDLLLNLSATSISLFGNSAASIRPSIDVSLGMSADGFGYMLRIKPYIVSTLGKTYGWKYEVVKLSGTALTTGAFDGTVLTTGTLASRPTSMKLSYNDAWLTVAINGQTVTSLAGGANYGGDRLAFGATSIPATFSNVKVTLQK